MSTPPGRWKVERPATDAEDSLEILEILVMCDRADIETRSSDCFDALAKDR